MKAKMFRTFLPFAILFTIVSCTSNSKEDASSTAKLVTSYNYNDTELKLITLINNYRESQGLNSLQVINHISYKSEEHNIYMIDNKVVNHNYFQQRVDNLMQLLGAESVAENIAFNYQTAESVLNAWLNSPGHKANIVGDFTHFGIAVTTDPQTGKKYYTNLFIKKK